MYTVLHVKIWYICCHFPFPNNDENNEKSINKNPFLLVFKQNTKIVYIKKYFSTLILYKCIYFSP